MLCKLTIFFGLILRVFISAWNGFVGPSFGADSDAIRFHLDAVAHSGDLMTVEITIGHIYSYVLGIFYYITTDSLFLGGILSDLAWLASAFLLLEIIDRLNIAKSDQFKVVLIYALMPSSLMLTSVTLREPFQMLFINLAFYAVLKIYLDKSLGYWALLFFSCAGMAALHGALLLFGLFIVIGAILLLEVQRSKNTYSPRGIFMLLLLILGAYFAYSFFSEKLFDLDRGIGAAIEWYQYKLMNIDARANYRSNLEIADIVDVIYFIPHALFQYLFEPMPWRISAYVDAVLLMENILRAWLILKAISGLLKMSDDRRALVFFIFLSYLFLELIWSVGVANWGTAIRHHLPAMSLLLISAFAYSKKLIHSRSAHVKVNDLLSIR